MNSDDSYILALETARPDWSVSLLRGSQIISYRLGNSTLTASETLLPAISSMLEESRISIRDLSAVAVAEGPGSFTGIRVGLATAQALAFGIKVNCFGIPLFEALALTVRKENESGEVCVIMDAGNKGLYHQLFSNDKQLMQPLRLIDSDDFRRLVTGIRERREQGSDSPAKIKIVTDGITSVKFEQILNSLDVGFSVKIASDNVSEYVGLKYLARIKESNNKSFENSQNIVKPLYGRTTRIGRG